MYTILRRLVHTHMLEVWKMFGGEGTFPPKHIFPPTRAVGKLNGVHQHQNEHAALPPWHRY